MLVGVQIEHELRQRPLQPRDLALVHDETRARKLRRGLEVHQAETFAQIKMFFRLEFEPARLAPAQDLDIIVLVLAVGNAVQRRIGDFRQRLVERGDSLPLGGLHRRPVFLDFRDFGLEGVGAASVLLLHRHADFLRGGVAALLRGLQLGNRRAARIVERQQRLGERLKPAPGAAFVEGFGVVANPFDVVHESVRRSDKGQATLSPKRKKGSTRP